MTNNIIIIHYAEIALKGENRRYFENRLIENMSRVIRQLKLKYDKIVKISGGILIDGYSESEKKDFCKALKRVFGISNFSFGKEIKLEITEIELGLKEELAKKIKETNIKTFRITAKRSDKRFPIKSEEINRKIGEYIFEQSGLGLAVKLKAPDINCYIEIVDGRAFIYFKREHGLGGLPVGTSGKVLSLISSGFDSPVAVWHLMKRGAQVDFVHFHSYPRTSKASINNVKELVHILNQYQTQSILYLVPLLEIQREIFSKCEERLRIILYRRFMFRIAEALALKINAGALVTGESLGQVASQTLENINVVNNAISIPVFRPFIGTDKIEIIDEAKKIGTYEFSSQPYEDCCSLFTPRHPATMARLEQIKIEESKLDSEKLIKETIEKIEKVIFKES